VRRIGVLAGLAEDDPEIKARLGGFRQGLERLGWEDGRNVRIDYRYAPSGTRQEQALAKELVALQSDAIVGQGPAVAAALQRESRTVPVVFVNLSDPIGLGFVASLARPGGNFTGLLNFEASITGKWLAMLKEIAPGLARVALLANPRTASYDHFLRAAETLAPPLALELIPSPVETATDIERAVESFARAPNGGLVLVPDNTAINHRDRIIALAARHQLPAVYFGNYFVTAGGLMSYGIDQVDVWRQAASYVDRILRGSKPSDLPVQAPTKYETVLNLKTAKALGLDVPPSLLVRADKVIE
jgi:putative ABC transport system substrate-binding protein